MDLTGHGKHTKRELALLTRLRSADLCYWRNSLPLDTPTVVR